MTSDSHFIGYNSIVIRAWRLNEADIVAAETLDAAIDWYMRETGLSREEAVDSDHLRELELPRLGWYEDEEDGSRVQCTMAELIARHKGTFPCVLCSYYS